MDSAPFMQSLPNHHWKALMKLMHRAEVAFEQILEHQVVSHIQLAKSLVHYKSIIQVFLKGHLTCQTDDEIVTHLCFPS